MRSEYNGNVCIFIIMGHSVQIFICINIIELFFSLTHFVIKTNSAAAFRFFLLNSFLSVCEYFPFKHNSDVAFVFRTRCIPAGCGMNGKLLFGRLHKIKTKQQISSPIALASSSHRFVATQNVVTFIKYGRGPCFAHIVLCCGKVAS